MNPSDFNLTQAAYGVSDVLRLLSIGRTSLYAAIRDGRLRASKIGKKTVFLTPDLVAYLSALPKKPGAESAGNGRT